MSSAGSCGGGRQNDTCERGRVPLVVREDGGSGYWRLVDEAYVHGIMDGQTWEEGMCKEFKIR